MKKYQLFKKLIIAFTLPLLLVACDDDEASGPGVDFGTIASSYDETDGTGTLTIPLRNAGSASNLSVSFGGTATEGEDFELVGVTAEGVQISVIDDEDYESMETIRVELKSSSGKISGNNFHTINILSNCEDAVGMTLHHFNGEYETAYTIEGTTYAPYHEELEADEEDETLLWSHDFFAEPIEAYIKVDLAAGTAFFPDQDAGGYEIANSSGTITYDLCTGEKMLVIDLDIDGDPWTFSYTF